MNTVVQVVSTTLPRGIDSQDKVAVGDVFKRELIRLQPKTGLGLASTRIYIIFNYPLQPNLVSRKVWKKLSLLSVLHNSL